ncbi:MAG: Rieske 2Fe-2S domain-containing protein [Alphaproteobacteria bacterium]|nr:Rieske 2Fe-2S domain-containing protein [Alphaproteobacteria bacterium]
MRGRWPPASLLPSMSTREERMYRAELVRMAKESISHAASGTVNQAQDVFRVPAEAYTDEARHKREIDRIFKRLPLVLAATAELPENGDYKAMEAVGVPVLMTRGKDGAVRAFMNSCTHRGTYVAVEGRGNTALFTCPYHGWTFNREGALVGIASREDFGDVDPACLGLKPLPVLERAGLIWVILDPKSTLDIAAFLSGYDDLLQAFGFEHWHLFSQRTIKGPNWKIAYDGYLDFYHLPVLHGDTFGRDISNKALYFAWGPHQRVATPSAQVPSPDTANLIRLDERPESEWDTETLLSGVWTIFPHVSIASFYGGGRGVMISQLFPGENAGESFTTQLYLLESEPTPSEREEATKQFELLKYVVQTEDYETGMRQQKALQAGALDKVLFGRNEAGGQNFHRWVQTLLDTDDGNLQALFLPRRAAAE